MLACLLLNLATSAQGASQSPPASKPPEPPQALVVIQDRGILLPALPKDPDEAHRGYKDIQARLLQENKDLEDILLVLYASKGANDPLPPSLKLTDEEWKEAEALVGIIKSTRAAAEEQAVLGVWKEWRAVLKENGVLGPPPGAAKAPVATTTQVAPGREKEYEALRKRLSRMDPQFWINQRDPFTYSNMWEFDDVYDHEGHEKDIAQTARRVLVAQWMGPQFAEAWNPLRDHLQASSAQLQALEGQRSARNPGLEQLRLKAKIQHLERFRAALWFCGVVWSEMSSSKLPPPLKSLRPQPMDLKPGH